jgi:hypothetical protein
MYTYIFVYIILLSWPHTCIECDRADEIRLYRNCFRKYCPRTADSVRLRTVCGWWSQREPVMLGLCYFKNRVYPEKHKFSTSPCADHYIRGLSAECAIAYTLSVYLYKLAIYIYTRYTYYLPTACSLWEPDRFCLSWKIIRIRKK